ncbi:uncharacterized protein LOC117169765 [Belonocnema kinseyi]|uniref:uncharacterized protein LOC117169765 n=1 Tax=Belonocnema kinseyi TaxID=2817044 RepID=UPI00143D8818|nr:uncharacterized protein LOC117169765 [Belonocnema kinseyi]
MKDKGDCVLLHKPQGVTSSDHPQFKDENFILIIITYSQAELLKKHGEDIICVDGTHGKAEVLLEIDRNSLMEEIKESIIRLHPRYIQDLLRMCGFKLAKLDMKKMIVYLPHVEDGVELEKELRQSKIVVLPKNDFPTHLPLINAQPPSQTITISNSSHVPARNSTSAIVTTNDRVQRTRRVHFLHPVEQVEDFEDSDADEDTAAVDQKEILNLESSLLFPSLKEDAERTTIEISRQNCLHDLLQLYTDKEIVNKNLEIKFIGELGINGGGLTKELFNIFFIKCQGLFFQGEDCLVPYLELSKCHQQDHFIIIGRISQHMLLLTNTLPAKISKITLMLIGDPNKDIDSDVLLQELGNYVNPYLRKIFKKDQKNFSALSAEELETILDFFQSNWFDERPSSEAFLEQLKVIANETLVEKPDRLILKMRQGVIPENILFFGKSVISEFFRKCKPL